jgi:tol-pal system protein YbgF
MKFKQNGREANKYSGLSHSIVSAALISSALALVGCASSQPGPEVTEAAQAAQDPSPQNFEMIRALSQVNDLKEELKLLRNAVEEMQFQQGNADRRQQDLFQDIDRRLLALEISGRQRQAQVQDQTTLSASGQVLAEGQTGSRQTGSRQTGSQQDSDLLVDTQQSDTSSAVESDQPPQVDSVTVSSAVQNNTAPNLAGTGSSSVSMTEQQAYDAAFELLKQSRYEDAIEQFQAMVNTWPQSQLADDALYWMSEANYVNREFEAALNGFRAVVERYPDSSRLPEAMLKVGYIQYDIGAYEQAAQTFQDVLTRFPGHQVTVSAETRLRRIQQTIQ